MDLEHIYSNQIRIGTPAIGELPPSTQTISGSQGIEPGDSAVRAELTKLAARLFLSQRSGSPHVVAFTSVDESAEETGIAARTAEMLAQLVPPQLVCVVDANLSSPSVHRIFGVPNERGWSEFLAQDVSALQHAQSIADTNVWVMPCGASISRMLERDHVARLQNRIKALRDEFAFVLIQAPPALSPETLRLNNICDGLVLVLEANSTQREKALSVTIHLRLGGARILGAVLSDCSSPIPQAISGTLR